MQSLNSCLIRLPYKYSKCQCGAQYLDTPYRAYSTNKLDLLAQLLPRRRIELNKRYIRDLTLGLRSKPTQRV